MAAAPDFRDVTVSPVYRTGKGWAVTLCAVCRIGPRRQRDPERRMQTA